MVLHRDQFVRDAASRGRYAPLYRYLVTMDGSDWHVTFAELEAVLGFELPPSARLYWSWWSNQKHGPGHSHALAWYAAGWRVRTVDLEAEVLVFERAEQDPSDEVGTVPTRRKFDLDEIWPPIPGGSWPSGFTVSRDQIYDKSGRLTGGPQDEPANNH